VASPGINFTEQAPKPACAPLTCQFPLTILEFCEKNQFSYPLSLFSYFAAVRLRRRTAGFAHARGTAGGARVGEPARLVRGEDGPDCPRVGP